MTQAPVRPAGLRADAVRNRASILEAARKLIGRRGAEAGMDEIAREAGVAVGTLYRHFPTKHDLVQAILEELTQHVFALLDRALAGIDAGATAAGAVGTLLAGTTEAIGNDRAVKAAITSLGLSESAEATERARRGLGRVVAAGHADGSLRAGTTVEDLVLVLATIPGDEVPPAGRKRWLELMLRALTA